MIFYWYIFNIFVDDEDGGGVAIKGPDVENFGFPYAHFNLHIPISKMNEDMNFLFISMQKSSWIFKDWHVVFLVIN